jgi:hypothetical protein
MSKKYRYEQLKPGDLGKGRIKEECYVWLEQHTECVAYSCNDDGGYVLIDHPDGGPKWKVIESLYRRVEIEEREPLEGWVVKSPNGEPDYFYKSEQMELIDWEDYAFNRWCAESMRFMREVIPPEVKELPDCEGWWCEKDPIAMNGPRICWVSPNGIERNSYMKGEWIYLDDLIKQAWRDAE